MTAPAAEQRRFRKALVLNSSSSITPSMNTHNNLEMQEAKAVEPGDLLNPMDSAREQDATHDNKV